MLILTRRIGEKLVIGEVVTVSMLRVKGNLIRIGIEAPDEISVHREEIYERMLKERATLYPEPETLKRAGSLKIKDQVNLGFLSMARKVLSVLTRKRPQNGAAWLNKS